MTDEEWLDLEELLEFSDDPADIDREALDRSERGLDRANTTTTKHWINAQGALHVHLRVRPRFAETQARNLCLTFVRKCCGADMVIQEPGIGIPTVDRRDLARCGDVQVFEKGTVLVDVGQLGYDGQVIGAGVFSEFPAFVRLLSLDDIPGRSVLCKTVQGACFGSLGVSDASEASGFFTDWEGIAGSGTIAFCEHQLPDDMIQSAPQVVDDVSTDDPESKRRRFIEQRANRYGMPHSVKGVIGRGSVGVRFDESFPLSVERVEVFFSPFDLGYGAIEGWGHGVDSDL